MLRGIAVVLLSATVEDAGANDVQSVHMLAA